MPRRRTLAGAITPALAESSGISWPSGGKRIILIPPAASAGRPATTRRAAGYLPEGESVGNRWRTCGKPVDDPVEKPVDFPCRYHGTGLLRTRVCPGMFQCR